MTTTVPCAELPSGALMPVLGLGTWQLTRVEDARVIARAAELGYRLFDTAEEYGTEANVAVGLRTSGVPRNEFFISTKVYFNHLQDGVLQEHASQSLERLDCDWLDLVLVHWPNFEVPLDVTIEALNTLVDTGVSRSIGLSNFPPNLMRRAIELSRHPLVTNQVEYHPRLDQSDVLGILRQNSMVLTAHTPLGMGQLVADPVIRSVAERRGATPAQILLRWLTIQDRVVAIPRTRSLDRLQENLDSLTVELTQDDLSCIAGLKSPDGRIVNPPFAPDWNG